MTLGRNKNKIILSIFPSQYHGETQDEDSHYTIEFSTNSNSERTNTIAQGMPTFKSLGLGEYFVPPNQVEDSDAAIKA